MGQLLPRVGIVELRFLTPVENIVEPAAHAEENNDGNEDSATAQQPNVLRVLGDDIDLLAHANIVICIAVAAHALI